MKTNIKNLFLVPALMAGLSLILDCPLTMAQTFTNLHSFNGIAGSSPLGQLIVSGNTLYGTTRLGGSSSNGTVFRVNTDGTGFTNLHSFTAYDPGQQTNSDGYWPVAGLLLVSNKLYGAAQFGGNIGDGTIFTVNTDGTGFATLHVFSDGSRAGSGYGGCLPASRLIISGNTLYGTAQLGGSYGSGTIFAINIDGTGFTNLYSFTQLVGTNQVNNDGAHPFAGLLLSGNSLYGTAEHGGSSGYGTVFKINTNGTGFTNLHSFTGGSNGDDPRSELLLLDDTLYGTASGYSTSGYGVVFAIKTDGTGYTNLHSFTGIDGSNPNGALILSGKALVGTTWSGSGSTYNGTVFAVNTNGTGYTSLYYFSALNASTNSDGVNPPSGLTRVGNNLFGTTSSGGASGYGTIFGLTLPSPHLSIATFSNTPVVFWPASESNYVLQITTNLNSGIWTTASNGVPVIGLQITNLLNPSNAYFRLVQP